MNTDTNSNENQSLACDLTAIPASDREGHVVTSSQLFATAQEVQELTDGYAIRFSNQPGNFMAIARFIENERLCCSFFRFELRIEPNNGPLWLQLTGGEGVKEILKSTLLDDMEDKAALKQLIQTGGDARLDDAVAQTSLPLLKNVLTKASSD